MQEKKVKTSNIQLSIEKYAKNNDASVDIVDFTILVTKTLIKTSKDTDFTEFNEAIKETYNTYDKMIDYHVEFKQLHVIKLFEKQNQQYNLEYKLEFDEMNYNPKININPKSNIPRKKAQTTYMWLLKEINKIKAKNRILINIFDETYIAKLKLFTKHIYADKFKKTVKLPIIETIKPDLTQTAELILNYKKLKKNHEFTEVDAGDILVKYLKPKFGKNGLDAFGDVISSEYQKNSKDFTYDIDDETIQIKQDSSKKLYVAKVKGYVNFSKNLMFIDHTIKKRRLNRVDKKVSEHEDNDIKVVLSEKDSSQDSIGEGVELTSDTIHVEGFVGSNSKLNATKLIIDGATHQSSNQNAKYAKINRHKGNLRAHKADIKLLEGGTVYATTVNIDACLNGTIYAKDVNIKNVKSNLKVYASNSINITSVTGEDNLFNIDYKKIPILSKKIEFLDKDIEDLAYHLEEAKRHKKEKVEELEAKIKELKNEKKKIVNSINDATIYIEKSFRGLNKISFTISKSKELVYKTQAKKYSKFHLKIEDDKITLKPVNISIEI